MAKNNQKPPAKFPDIRSPWVIFFIFLIFIVLLFVGRVFPSMEEITWKDFEGKMLSRNAVDKIVVVNKETVEVYIKKELVKDSTFSKVLESPFSNEGINTGPHYTFNIGSIESFEKKMDEAQNNVPSPQRINVSYEESSHFNDVLS